MQYFLIALLALAASPLAHAFDSPEAVLSQVSQHCGGPQKCACFATNIDGFHLTFGNGSTILSQFPEFTFTPRPGEILNLAEADQFIATFKQTYQFDKLSVFCTNAGGNSKGVSEFGYDTRYELLDLMYSAQLQKNGGFCNIHQKCDCEFDMGGNEMSPDFRSKFEIAVSGSQGDPYNGGSTGGPISRPGQEPIFVQNLASVLGKSAAVKERFVASALQRLEPYRVLCRDFAPVLQQGKRQLLGLIHDLEHPSKD